MPTSGIEQCQPMASGKRQIFHAEIGHELAKLRELKNLSQGQVVQRGKGKITEGTLKAIETGRVKNPDPDHLRALATIYGVPFATVAEPFVRANYGPDLVRHAGDQESDLSKEGSPANVPAAARVLKLESDNEQLRAALSQVQDVASKLVQIAKAGVKGDAAAATRSGRRSRDRKVS